MQSEGPARMFRAYGTSPPDAQTGELCNQINNAWNPPTFYANGKGSNIIISSILLVPACFSYHQLISLTLDKSCGRLSPACVCVFFLGKVYLYLAQSAGFSVSKTQGRAAIKYPRRLFFIFRSVSKRLHAAQRLADPDEKKNRDSHANVYNLARRIYVF